MAFESVGTFLRRLALIAVGLSAGDAGGVARALEEIPQRALLQALQSGDDDDGGGGGGKGKRAPVLELLAMDARPGVRAAVARECADAAAGQLAWSRRTSLLRRLACDDDGQVRRAASSGLGQLFRGAGRARDASSSWDRLETTVAW